MRTVTIAIASVCLVAAPAHAAGPRFVAPLSNVYLDADENLVCEWREVGLGPNAAIEYNCGADDLYSRVVCSATGNETVLQHIPTASVAVLEGDGQIVGTLVYNADLAPLNGRSRREQALATIACADAGGVLEDDGVQWCGAWLADVTNGLVGPTAVELSSQIGFDPCP